MAKFRKKAIVIEAYQLQQPNAEQSIPPAWLLEAIVTGRVIPIKGHGVVVKTLEGDHRGDVGDWIIRGVKGELYPCKAEIFALTYEPAEANCGE